MGTRICIALENWFSHQEVQEYVEQLETKGALGIAKAGFSFFSSLSPDQAIQNKREHQPEEQGNLPMPGGSVDQKLIHQLSKAKLINKDNLPSPYAVVQLIASPEAIDWVQILRLK